jgi:hypothetical protein
MRLESPMVVIFVASLATAASSCATEPRPRPTALDPSNPAAPESPPLPAPSLGVDERPAPPDASTDAPEPGGHTHDHGSK